MNKTSNLSFDDNELICEVGDILILGNLCYLIWSKNSDSRQISCLLLKNNTVTAGVKINIDKSVWQGQKSWQILRGSEVVSED